MLVLIIILESLFFNYAKLYFTDDSLFLTVSFIIINTFITILYIIINRRDEKFKFILLLAFFLRLLLLFVDVFASDVLILPQSGGDSLYFDMEAKSYALSLSIPIINHYSMLLGCIYKLFFANRIVGQFINVIASLLSITIFYDLLSKLKTNVKIKQISILILAFFPNYAIVSSILLRESLMILLSIISLDHFVRWWLDNKHSNIFISFSAIIISSYLHSGSIMQLVGEVIIYSLFFDRRRKIKININTIFLLFIFIFAFYYLYTYMNSTFFAYFGKYGNLNQLNSISTRAATGNSAYNIANDSSSVINTIKNTPIRMVYFLFSPFPWDWRNLYDFIGFIGNSLYYIVCTIIIFTGLIRKGINKKLHFAILFITITGIFIYSWGVSNTGTAIRHRDKFIFYFLFLSAISVNSIRSQRKININNKLITFT